MTTSYGSLLPRSWRNRLCVSGRQPSSRCSVRASTPRDAGVAHRVGQPRGGDGGGRSEGDQRRRVVLEQQRDDPRDRRRLAGAGAAGDHREPAPQRGLGGEPLLDVVEAFETGRVEGRRRSGDQRAQVGGQHPLLAPVAVEVQRAALELQRTAHQGTSFRTRDPVAGVRPRKCLQVDRLVGVHGGGVADRRQVDVHVPEPRRADREGRGQRDRLVALARQRRQPRGDVHVGGREHAGVVELAQQSGGLDGDPRLAHASLRSPSGLAERRRPRESSGARSSASLNAVTSAAGGRQANTPHGVPSTTGVSGPTIPRTNR